MIFGGSVSLKSFLAANRIPGALLGGLDTVLVKPFTDAEMASYLDELANTHQISWWEERHNHRLRDCLADNYPFFARLGMDHVAILESADELEKCIREGIIPSLRRDFLYQFEERLSKRYETNERQQAKRVLDQIARNGPQSLTNIEGLISDPEIDVYHLINLLLRDDFLLENADQQYDFGLVLLRRHWRGRLGLTA